MNFHLIAEKAAQHVKSFFESHADKNFFYHNIQHTENVVKAAAQIASHYQLNDHDFFVTDTAAWFHDVGYLMEDGSQHEEKGATMATVFLQENGVDEATIQQVKQCILATKFPQSPATLVEKIVCDADLFHLGTDMFRDTDKQMREECEHRLNKSFSKKAWRNGTIQLMQLHHYHTDYCKLLLNKKKQENLNRLLKKQKENREEPVPIQFTATAMDEALQLHTKEKKTEKPTRGIETMFRVASTNHQRLSDMADSKAHIMISVNSIILSVVISLVVRKLDAATYNLVIPTFILLAGAVIAIIFSILATRPKIPAGYFTPEQLSNRSVNLLFFGNFYNMNYEQYYDGMKEMMNDSEFLYASLVRDIHSQGMVLGNKYKLLRISYTIFMFTLIVSVIAFAIAIIFFS